MFFSFIVLLIFSNTILSEIQYPLSDTEQQIRTGYFTENSWYLGGVPNAIETKQYYTCDVMDDNICKSWVVKRDKQNDLLCNCVDEVCNSWECIDYYTTTRQSTCECLEDSCSSWTCESYEEEVVKRNKHSKETALIVSTGQFEYVGDSEWIGITVSSTRYSQEVCNIGKNVMLWECSRKTYKNCRGKGSLWCNLSKCIGFLVLYLILSVIAIVSLYFKIILCSFLTIFLSIPVIYVIVVSGGYTGILSLGVISLVSLISYMFLFKT